ncbi:MAG: TRAP transporter small permease [Thermodesulfobacteriota bacterium]
MFRFEKTIAAFAHKVNWVAGGAVAAMMLLTTADVVLRAFRHPIPGAYEIVGLIGSLAISFSLAYTSIEKGHIAVEFLINRFSAPAQAFISAVNALVSTILFAVITWQGILYGTDFLLRGEVSMTIQLPIYPFVYGVAAGCGLLCPVLLVEFLEAVRRYRTYRNA